MQHQPAELTTEEAVLQALEKISLSRPFLRSRQLRKFLRHVVLETLAGRGDQISGYTIALDVLGRRASFDPSQDPIVRSEARRLRQKLKEYYRTEGQNDPILIRLEKGSYVPTFIERVTGAAEHEAQEFAAEPAAELPVKNAAGYPRLRWAALGGLSAAAILALALFNSPKIQPTTASTVNPVGSPEILTSYPGWEAEPALSPDGSRMAYSRRQPSEKQFDIWIKTIGEENSIQLTADPRDDKAPTWSPDGKSVAFVRLHSSRQQAALIVVPARGGTEKVLTEFSPGSSFETDWSPDGKSILLREGRSQGDLGGIALVSIETGLKRRIIDREFAVFPKFLEGGEQIAFFATDAIYTTDKEGKNERIVISGVKSFSGMTVCPTDRHLMYLNKGALWRVALAGGEPESIGLISFNAENPVHSHSGHLFYAAVDRRIDTLRIALTGNSKGAVESVLSSSQVDSSARISPKGNRLAFVSDRTGSERIWTSKADGSDARPLTDIEAAGSPKWSPDGERIVFHAKTQTGFTVFDIAVNGGTPRRLSQASNKNDLGPNYSPDGRWIYFGSNRSGVREIWRMAAAGESTQPATQVTHGGGFCPAISHDNRYLYYSISASNKSLSNRSSIWRMSLHDGSSEPVVEVMDSAPCNWTLKEDGLYFIGATTPLGEGDDWAVFHVGADLETKLVVRLPSKPLTGLGRYGFDVSDDGHSALFSTETATEGNLMRIVMPLQDM